MWFPVTEMMHPATSPPTLGRRRLLAGAVTAAVAGLAGCSDGDGGDTPDDPTAYLPASASLLIDVDMALTGSAETQQILEAYGEGGGEDPVATFEERTGLAVADVDHVLVFADETQPDRASLVISGDYGEGEVVDALASTHDTNYERGDRERGTLYRPDDDGPPTLGFAATGQYVVGDHDEVAAALDTFFDQNDPLEGRLRDAFDADREREEGTQYVLAATDNPRSYLPPDGSERVPAGVSLDLFSSVNTATAGYFVTDEGVGVDVVLRTGDETLGQEIEDFSVAILAFLRSDADDDAVVEELSKIRVEREGSVVTVAYRSDAAGAATLVEWLGSQA